MATQDRLPGVPALDPRSRTTDHRRDHLALRSPDLEVSEHRALDREAECLEALAAPLVGVASLVSGGRCPEHWRAALRGERHVWLVDLCRLATTGTREAHDAVRGVLAVLDRALRAHQPAGTIAGRAADAASAATGLLALVARAQEDGQIDDDEREQLRRAAVPLQRAVVAVEALLSGGTR